MNWISGGWLWLGANKDSLEAVFYLASAVVGAVAAWTYRRNAATRRAEWLQTLHEKFFEEGSYKRIRGILDYPNHPQRADLRRAIEPNSPYSELEEEFVDYLNFFEFVAGLWDSKPRHLRLREVNGLFNYYLENLVALDNADWVGAYLAKGFEHLQNLLDTMEKKGLFKET